MAGIWNIVVVQDLHIASRSIDWACDKSEPASPTVVAVMLLAIFGCFLLLLLHLGSCEVGKAPSKRLGENAFGVLLPYIDIGNERVTDGGTDSDHEREKTGHRVWYDNPLNLVDGLDRR